jgi:hypothetical protein
MNKIAIRPRFKLDVKIPKYELITRISKEIKSCNGRCEINLLRNHIIFKIPEDMQHFWSPELSIEIEESEENSVLHCILGPRSAIWTLFATFYGLSLFAGLIGIVLGLSQWSIGNYPYGFWLVPASVILIALAYLIAITGQKLSYNEMLFLRSKLERAIYSENKVF